MAVSAWVSPTVIDKDVLFKLTPVTETFLDLTETKQLAVYFPSFVCTNTLASPTAFAVTTPPEETVATEVLLENQVVDLSDAFDGMIVAVKGRVSPSVKVNSVGEILTDFTAT